jgi:hypothetical protein
VPIASVAMGDLHKLIISSWLGIEALNSGELSANSFQNQFCLDNRNADRGYKIVPVA